MDYPSLQRRAATKNDPLDFAINGRMCCTRYGVGAHKINRHNHTGLKRDELWVIVIFLQRVQETPRVWSPFMNTL